MNLQKLFETQKVLRDRIGYNEPDRFEKLVLALNVEIGECANEWQLFKFWKKNPRPRKIIHTTQGATPENASFFKCSTDECGEYLNKEDFTSLFDEPDYELCPKCQEGYVYPMRPQNPLLEEYVDGLHFVLELGIELNFDTDEIKIQIDSIGIHMHSSTTEQFNAVFQRLAELTFNKLSYERLLFTFLGLGRALGFTPEQIEAAYMEKNKVNHERQNSGY